jgi:SAM-dependent methyltransferase
MPHHNKAAASPDLGYHWVWTYGHLIPAGLFAMSTALAVWRGAPWWLWAPLAAITAWALAGFLVMRFKVRINEVFDLPSDDFLPSGEGTVLDVGCGAGRVSIAVARAKTGVQVVGLDNFSADYIQDHGSMNTEANFCIASVQDRATVQSGDMRDMPFDDASFDAAASSAAIDHLPPADIRKTLGEVNRVLRPSGRFLLMVIVPNLWMALAFGPFVHRGFAGRSFWRESLTEAGFTLDGEGTSRGVAWFLASRGA